MEKKKKKFTHNPFVICIKPFRFVFNVDMKLCFMVLFCFFCFFKNLHFSQLFVIIVNNVLNVSRAWLVPMKRRWTLCVEQFSKVTFPTFDSWEFFVFFSVFVWEKRQIMARKSLCSKCFLKSQVISFKKVTCNLTKS